MKKLNRLLLIHWYSYEHEIIEFDGINFLTGKTASGKSTIIDALQMVLLGETNPSIFNKAANKDSKRNLPSYLYGELGDDGDSSYRYIRSGEPFTSYVAAEFRDTEKNKYFTNIFTADCYADLSEPSRRWIILNEAIPDNHFIDPLTHSSYNFVQLKGFLKHTYGQNAYSVYDTNNAYQQVLLGRYGQVRKKYLTLLKNAVPFTPVSDIAGFITDSICDVKGTINVEEMQSDIRQYKGLENDAKRTQERIDKLQEIHSIAQECLTIRQRRTEQQYVLQRADMQEKIDKKEEYLKNLEEYQAAKAEKKTLLDLRLQEREQLSDEQTKLLREQASSDIGKKQDILNNDIQRFQTNLDVLKQAEDKAYQRLHASGFDWQHRITSLQNISFDVHGEEIAVANTIAEINAAEMPSFDYESLALLRDFNMRINEQKAVIIPERNFLDEELQRKKKKIDDLKKGIKPYKQEVITLKKSIEAEILQRKSLVIHVDILADCLEIKDQTWRNAIEGYLNTQKYYLIVPEEYYLDALHIYDEAKEEMNLYNVGLIDIAKLKKEYQPQIKKNSLAEEIESDNEDALLYARYLLQDVIKCETVDELNTHRIGITRTCMLYKNYVSRRISPKQYENPFIGRKSLQQLLDNLQKETEQQRKQLDELNQRYRVLAEAGKIEPISSNDALAIKNDTSKRIQINDLEMRLEKAQKELAALDLTYLDALQKKINSCKTNIANMDNDIRQLENDAGKIDEKINTTTETLLPQVEQEIQTQQTLMQERFHPDWIKEIGEPRYLAALKEERSLSLKESFNRTLTASETTLNNYEKKRNNLRQNYVTDYKLSFAIAADDNSEFEQDLANLQNISLPEYLGKITDAKQKAYEKFRDDFIAKLKSNIEEVKRQIDELNFALRASQFGTDRYHFTISARKEYKPYYDMIMDPMLMEEGGYNLLSSSFNDKYANEIKELFDMLIENETFQINTENKVKYEENIRKFTDYRTYLTFDLIVTDEEGVEQRLSKTMLKKSGGETQIPFYISLLASFAQVCNVQYKSKSNTIRLIILDEAFSKMDGERIRECIPLLRRFGLQAIFSAPPDKIGDIADLVDRNIAVYKDGHRSYTKYFDPKQIDEELMEEDV